MFELIVKTQIYQNSRMDQGGGSYQQELRHNLNMIDDLRNQAALRMTNYHQRVARDYNN